MAPRTKIENATNTRISQIRRTRRAAKETNENTDAPTVSNVQNGSETQPKWNSTDYCSMPNLHADETVCTPHLTRKGNNNMCIFCDSPNSPYEDQFQRDQKIEGTSKDVIVADELVQCEYAQCHHKFHLACITYSRTIYKFNAQYLSLPTYFGKVQCPSHFCESCFNDRYQQSASIGILVIVGDKIRSFHICCLPAGATLKDGILSLAPQTAFEGDHFPICHACGEKDANETLVKCSTCLNCFHSECNPIIKTSAVPNTQCDECLFDFQKRVGECVLVKSEGVFRAARILPEVRKLGFAVVQLMWNNQREEYPVNSLFRPYQSLSTRIWDVVKQDKLFTKYGKEMKHIEVVFQERVAYRPPVERPAPVFKQEYVFHNSLRDIVEVDKLSAKFKSHKNMEVKPSPGLGLGLFSTKKVEKFIGEYTGEVMTEEECDRRISLAICSSDIEFKCYWFKTFLEVNGVKKPVVIDGANIGNELKMINSCCKPNCSTVTNRRDIPGGVLGVLRVKAGNEIEAGTEITINYNWNKSIICRCRFCEEKKAKAKSRAAMRLLKKKTRRPIRN